MSTIHWKKMCVDRYRAETVWEEMSASTWARRMLLLTENEQVRGEHLHPTSSGSKVYVLEVEEAPKGTSDSGFQNTSGAG